MDTGMQKKAFELLEKALVTPLMLTHQLISEVLYLYLVVSEEAISVVLIEKSNANKNPIYFISKALAGQKICY